MIQLLRVIYLCFSTIFSSFCFAQAAFPARPVSLMVPYPAGSASDFTARALGESVGKELGAQVIVENVGGASGAIAVSKVLNAPADGYYVFQGSPNELLLPPLVNKTSKFKAEDFKILAPVATSQLVLIVNGKLPVNSMDDLVEVIKSRKNSPLTFGSPGTGSLYHLLGELLAKRTGVPLVHVPYKGGAPLLQDLMGGQIDFAFTPYQSSYADYSKQGHLKVVGTLSDAHLPAPFQNVQTYAQTKQLKDFKYSIWTGYFVKPGTPAPVVERLSAAFRSSVRQPHVRTQLEAQAKIMFAPTNAREAEQFYMEENNRYRDLVKTIGYEPQ